MKLFLPFIRRRSQAHRIYQRHKKAHLKQQSDFLKDPDFFAGYQQVIDIPQKLPSRGMLTICPTPLGNLQDISTRQHKALLTADILACQDTRLTGLLIKLLQKQVQGEFPPKNFTSLPEFDDYTYGLGSDFISHTVENIKKSKQEKGRGLMISFNSFNAERRTPKLVKAMKSGIQVVLVSDAGTPLISDPGYYLVKQSLRGGLLVETLPGGVAAVLALVSSGFPVDNFFFLGYLPKIFSEKLDKLKQIQKNRGTSVIYQSPHRAVQTVQQIKIVFGPSHPIFVAQELTKLHQNFYRGTVEEVLKELQLSKGLKERLYGQITIVISPSYAKNNPNLITLDQNHLVNILKTRVKADQTSMKKLIQLITGFSKKKIQTLLNEQQQ